MASTLEIHEDLQLLPVLTPQAEITLLARILFREGWSDYNAGHITYRQPDNSFLALPSELGWNEVSVSDVLRIDLGGNTIEGRWTATPSIRLHMEFHRATADCTVTIHQHPRFATIYSAVGRIPPPYDQRSANIADDDIVLYDDYEGGVSGEVAAKAAVSAIGGHPCALLRNHGVFVAGASIPQAFTRAIALEWRCKQAWHVEAVGGGKAMPPYGQAAINNAIEGYGGVVPNLWEWAVRRELRTDPAILS